MSVNAIGPKLFISISLELVYHIVEHFHNDIRTLLSCALVSHAWAHVAQRCLYSSVTVEGVRPKHYRTDLTSFLDHLNQFQAIGPYVAHLHIEGGTCGLSGLLAVVNKLACLRTLTIDNTDIAPFVSLPSHALLTRELECFEVKGCKILHVDQPWRPLFDLIAMFSSIENVNLTDLEIKKNASHAVVSLRSLRKTQVKGFSYYPGLDGFGEPVAAFVKHAIGTIDMDSVAAMWLTPIFRDHLEYYQSLIGTAKRLKWFSMGFRLAWVGPPLHEISLASCTSLKFIEFSLLSSYSGSSETGISELGRQWDHALTLLSSLPRQSSCGRTILLVMQLYYRGTASSMDAKLERLEWRKLDHILTPFKGIRALKIFFLCPIAYAGSFSFNKDELLAGLARRFVLDVEWRTFKI